MNPDNLIKQVQLVLSFLIILPSIIYSNICFNTVSKQTKQCGKTELPRRLFALSDDNLGYIYGVTKDSIDLYNPPDVGVEIYVGSAVSLVPIIWATYEFSKRIIIQKKCLVCRGTGLTSVTRNGVELKRLRKCWSCGGFLPWLGWKQFFFSSVTPSQVGNGGVLQRPAKDYDQINEALNQSNEKNEITNEDRLN